MSSFDPPAGDQVPGETGNELVNVSVEWHGSTALIGVSGEVDVLSAPRLEKAASDALDEGPAILIIDLSAVDFLASAGLAVLAGSKQLAGEKVDFRVVAEGSATGRPLHLTGLDQDFPVYPSREEALTTDR